MLLNKQARLQDASSLISYVTKRTKIKSSNPVQHGHSHFKAIRTLDICRVAISPVHKISYAASIILKDTSHVLHAPTRQRYEAILNGQYDKRQEGLWIVFNSNAIHSKRVVRTWAKRRVTRAVVEELQKRGFDKKGKKIVKVEGGQLAAGASDVLVGTVGIEVLKKCVEAQYDEVQRQAGLMVQEILSICEWRRKGVKRRQGRIAGNLWRNLQATATVATEHANTTQE